MLLFNRYEYDPQKDLLGKGGFSKVFRAVDKRFNRLVALKIYKSEGIDEKYGLSAEIQRIIELDHPNICRYIDIEEMSFENAFGEREVSQVCILEMLDAGDLKSYLKKNCSPEIRIKLFIDVLYGLAYLHNNGIIHRDIKPPNILIKETVDGPVAKISDFGISKKIESVSDNSSAVLGSIEYMAPEQFNAAKYGINGKLAPNLDLWSFGVMLFELLSGNQLFGSRDTGTSTEQVMSSILYAEILDKVNTIEEPFKTVISNCLQKEASKRVKSAHELIAIIKSGDLYVRTTEGLHTKKIAAVISKTTQESRPGRTETYSSPETTDYGEKQLSNSEVKINSTQAGAKANGKIATHSGYKEPERSSSRISLILLILLMFFGLLGGGLFYLSQNSSKNEAVFTLIDSSGFAKDTVVLPLEAVVSPALQEKKPASNASVKSLEKIPKPQVTQANIKLKENNITPPMKDESVVVEPEVEEEPKEFTFVERLPEFPGGDGELLKFLQRNIQYPQMERENDIQGKVLLRFVVNEDGSISDINVIRAVSPGLDLEAVRVVKLLPRFKPGTQQGKAVKTYFNMPVVFKLT